MLAGIVILILTYVVLGHEGRVADGPQFRLTLFEGFGSTVRCLIECNHKRAPARYLLINFVGNIAVFMPLGMALTNALRWHVSRPGWLATVIGTMLSLLYEIIQLGIPGRVTALDDVLLNGIGAALGAILMMMVWQNLTGLETVKQKGQRL